MTYLIQKCLILCTVLFTHNSWCVIEHLKIKNGVFEKKLKWMQHLIGHDEWTGKPLNMDNFNQKFAGSKFIAQLRAHNWGIVWYEFYLFTTDEDVQKLRARAKDEQCSDIYWRYINKTDFEKLNVEHDEMGNNSENELTNENELGDWIVVEREKSEAH